METISDLLDGEFPLNQFLAPDLVMLEMAERGTPVLDGGEIALRAIGHAFAYRDRRQKKRQFRRLWIVRINAAARQQGADIAADRADTEDADPHGPTPARRVAFVSVRAIH